MPHTCPTPPEGWHELDAVAIQSLLPHRYPFLMIDRGWVSPDTASLESLAWKNLTNNEFVFSGHFPGAPVMPGVLIVEAMAQTAALAALWHTATAHRGRPVYLLGIEKARFKQPAYPGSRLTFRAAKARSRGGFYWFQAHYWVDSKLGGEAVITTRWTP